jgi:hypothetical protein
MEAKVKAVILTTAQQQLIAMRESGWIRVPENDVPDCLTEKLDPTSGSTLEELNAWLVQIGHLVGPSNLTRFGYASAERHGETGIYRQSEVTLEQHGFSLGSKLLLSFAGVSHPYTEWSYAEIDESRGVGIDVAGSKNRNDEQCATTCGWVNFLSQKLFGRPIDTTWESTGRSRRRACSARGHSPYARRPRTATMPVKLERAMAILAGGPENLCFLR